MRLLSETHPSRIFSFCPHCGNKGFTFDSIKLFTCPACGFRYYINATTAVAAILLAPDGQIVLTRRKNEPRAGTFDLPGGFVDTMERAEDAVKREVQEELGITVDTMQFLTSYANEYVYKGISYFTCDLAFVCPVADLSMMKPYDDVAEAILIHPKNIDFNTISFMSIVNILKVYIKDNF
jgi:ADP-ribose pyrophosphatase YjhB (NUDIX family)